MKRLLAALGVAALSSGCSSIWSRGLVQDQDGQVLGAASVRVESFAGSGTIVTSASNEFGCFLFGRVPPRGERRFRLEIEAPGYEAASFDFDLQTPVLIVTLAKSGSAAQSQIHPASRSEIDERWTPYCNPPLPPGAQALSP